MPYELWFPEQPTEEEQILREKYEVLRNKRRQVLEHAEAAKKLAEQPKLSPADAKERAKKLVLAGEVSLLTKPIQEKTAFKRPLLAKKIPSSKITGAKTVGGGTASVVSDTAHLKRGGTASTFPNTEVFKFQEKEVSLTIPPRLETYTPNVPKWGPAIYVTVKNHPHALSEAMLKVVFGKFGIIDEIKPTYPGVAFVTFRSVENAERAIAEMNGAFHNGVEFSVEFAWRQPHCSKWDTHRSHDAVAANISPCSSEKAIGNTNWDNQRQLVVYKDDAGGI
ncbi:unnamed protein product [Orchesella dallaii]|uniref:Negative elongation factor E n=1 Tax=Orchesella dallaii TaxID=48710 RepID=A0ABP1RNV6_9HEXA